MTKNPERIQRVQSALKESQLDAFVCTFAAHVVMLSGYWPVIGTSFAIAARDGSTALLVPKDEEHLTGNGWADIVKTFESGGLSRLETPAQAVVAPLRGLIEKLGLSHARIGYEHGPVSEPASYASMHIFGASILDVLAHAAPKASIDPADDIIERLDSVKTPVEVERIRRACVIAGDAFRQAKKSIEVGAHEFEIASRLRAGLATGSSDTTRAGGFAFCMSGERSAYACGAFAQTGDRKVQDGDLVLLHCNSYVNGYWTDITRTNLFGDGDERCVQWREAILDARSAALARIAPGVRAAEVDGAAREVFAVRGLEKLFRHSTGHGVGFAAISANARPRLHPKSSDVLEEGSVFNVEPALYMDGFGGMRHCDMVAIVNGRAEVLTPFELDIEDLSIRRAA